MFLNLFWKFRYYRLLDTLTDLNDIYHDKAILMKLIKLGSYLTEREVNMLLESSNAIIATSYDNVDKWLKQMVSIQKQIANDSLALQPVFPARRVRIEDFLMTEDDKRVEPYSALRTIESELLNLHTVIETIPEKRREFMFKQNRELFQTGIAFYIKVLELYAT